MESINKLPGQIMGLEVLRFENAEIQKIRDSTPLFAGFGPLSVFYFPMYSRFMLQINDWRYPLLKRIPITGGQPNEAGLKDFTFPGPNGTSYHLKINDSSNLGALSNFEAILMGASRFDFKTEGGLHRKSDASPDDKVVRHVKAQPGIIAGALKTASNMMAGTTESIKAGTKKLMGGKKLSKKMRSNRAAIKARDFKAEAKSSFKKDFFPSSHKFSDSFLKKRSDNPFLSQGKTFEEILKASDKSVPSLYFFQDDIEGSILSAKEFASSPQFSMPASDKPEGRGFIANLKQGLQGVKEGISSRLPGGQERGRTAEQEHKLPEQEGMVHYQG